MSMITLASAGTSPGVTSTAVALTLGWTRPALLVEADTSKPSSVIPGFMQAGMDASRGLLPLAVNASREGMSAETVWEELIPLHHEPGSVPEGYDKYVLPAFSNITAARGMDGLWSELSQTLSQLGTAGVDVFIDAGRLSENDARLPLITGSDMVLLVIQPTLAATAALAAYLNGVKAALDAHGKSERLGLVVVEHPTQNIPSREITQYLRVPVLARIPWDPRAAAVYSTGAPKPTGFRKAAHGSSIRALGAALEGQLKAYADVLDRGITYRQEAGNVR
jgi:hypothetical protein